MKGFEDKEDIEVNCPKCKKMYFISPKRKAEFMKSGCSLCSPPKEEPKIEEETDEDE